MGRLMEGMSRALPSPWPRLMDVDRAHVWHPFTQMKEHEADPPVPVVGGEGCDLLLADGRRLLDGNSSWWTCLHGHGHPVLVKALADQAARLDHVMFAGFTHEPAIALVEGLRRRMPAPLTRCFFSDNGSTAVEVALKMAFQAQLQRGEKDRNRFGALRDGYHGDTLGAVGVGELENFMAGIFSPLLCHCERLEVPEDPRRELAGAPADWPETLEATLASIRTFFATHGPRLAAFIAEPLVQGAGGFRMWPVEALQEIRRQCDVHGVYLIQDEVMTGFGRTGTFLAADQTGVIPDFITLSKGLTGGMLPLSLTWTTEAVFQHFWADYVEGRTFFHGHSYTGNPIACAVAAASLSLFETEDTLSRAQAMAEALKEAWTDLADHPAVTRARCLGPMAACNLVDPATGRPHPMDARIGWRLHRTALDHGLLVRPIGDCLYLLPPMCTPPDRIREAVATLKGLLPAKS